LADLCRQAAGRRGRESVSWLEYFHRFFGAAGSAWSQARLKT
jgi:hypothetical protein